MIKVEDFIDDPSKYDFRDVHIYFAKSATAVDPYLPYIKEARNKAFKNLYYRHDILIGNISITDNKYELVLPVYYPKETVFNAGKRLRGLSAYLLKHHGDIFESLRVGQRLFWYF